MSAEVIRMLDLAVRLELRVAELYTFFSETQPDDAEFWWRLAMEENNHASLIRAERDAFFDKGLLPGQLTAQTIDDLVRSNDRLAQLLAAFREKPPGRQEAMQTALEVEESAGEAHFQQTTEATPETPGLRIFQLLVMGDMGHAERIRARMRKRGMQPPAGKPR